jgi:hypothetical protein
MDVTPTSQSRRVAHTDAVRALREARYSETHIAEVIETLGTDPSGSVVWRWRPLDLTDETVPETDIEEPNRGRRPRPRRVRLARPNCCAPLHIRVECATLGADASCFGGRLHEPESAD